MTNDTMTGGEEVQSAVGRQAAEWFVANREGPLSAANRAAFTAWLRTSPIHVREYLAVSSLAREFGDLPDAGGHILDDLTARAREEGDGIVALAGRTPIAVPAHQAGRVSRTRRWALAASVAAVLLVAAFTLQRQGAITGEGRSDGNDVLTTAHGEQRVWRLPDGSVMHLNSGSGLRVRFTDRERVVEVDRGQALFDVEKDPDRPFRVLARGTEVVALGTSFEVYCKEQATVVTVVSGKVAVSRKDAAAGMIPAVPLGPGEQLSVAPDQPQPKVDRVDIARTVAWTQQQIMFDQERLADVVAEFNRYGRTPVYIEGETLNDLRITGIFNAYDTESFVGFLGRLQDVRVDTAGGKITVRKDSGT